jgi:uncharacterized protein (DUF488 family)
MIYTIGYQRLSLDRLTEIMDAEHIDKLLDVRSVPYSRWKPDFNKSVLAAAFGKRYCWKGWLLGGKAGPVTEEGIEYLVGLAAEKRYLLMCMEADPRDCHRFQDIGLRLLERGIDSTHIIISAEGWSTRTTTELKGDSP